MGNTRRHLKENSVRRQMFWSIMRELAVILALACSPIGLASAHHSIAEFDYSKQLILHGMVKEVQWTNPHSYIQVLVDNTSGSQEQWGIEFGSPSLNVRNGWKKDSVKPGDKVTLEIAPARNGSHYGTLRILTLPDGSKLQGVAASFKVDQNGNPKVP